MELKETDYDYLEEELKKEGKKIFIDIYNKLFKYLNLSEEKSRKKAHNINKFIGESGNVLDFFVVERKKVVKKYSDNPPPGHGGRALGDGLIHLYPNCKMFKDIDNIEQIKQIFINEILIHEIFHYYFSPDLYDIKDKNHGDDAWFGHALTEGLVQYFTEMYMKDNQLGESQTGYIEEVRMIENIYNELSKQYNNDSVIIIKHLMNLDQENLINYCNNGKEIKNAYIINHKIYNKICNYIDKNPNIKDKDKGSFKNQCRKYPNLNELKKQMLYYFKDDFDEINNIFQNDGLENSYFR